MVNAGTPVNEAEARYRTYNYLVVLWENEPSDQNTVELAWAWYRISSAPFICGGVDNFQYPPLRAFPTAFYNCLSELSPYFIRQIPSPVLAEATGWDPHILRQLCTSRPEPVFCYKENVGGTWVVYFGQQGFYSHTSLTSAIEDILQHWYDDPDPCNNDRWRLGKDVGELMVRSGIRREYVVGGMSFVWEWLTGGGFVEGVHDDDRNSTDDDGSEYENGN
ncbi:hypothetical protein DFJ43DRAFT_1155116 [Lentinula guzmanii]|uniref:Uncharacterized protein n=1 Tax=Lentinula guzmanii TaxID=2804957 RepID=A0AA38J9B8_9AGAR|nr:hypothetical protein DFJ43DRAFT_1155114 [Lentinula guzmanii]KAJ3731727.1 hypothetical protein DFJ43DRAFT_1155116 [Lentinula guzmanii]